MTPDSESRPVGLIAGEGELPVLASDRLIEDGYDVYICYLEGAPPEELRDRSVKTIPFDPGELGSVPAFFTEHDVDELYLLGNVDKTALYDEGNLSSADSTVTNLLDRLPDKGDEYLIKAATKYLSSRGLEVRGIHDLFEDSLMPEGHVAGPAPGDEQQKTIDALKPIARAVADAEVGQTVLGKRQSVVAIEAVEGTQKAIERAGRLAGSGIVMLKSARSDQDPRYDLPVVGLETMRALESIDASILAVEANRVLWLQEDDVRDLADQAGISVVGFTHRSRGIFGRLKQWLNGSFSTSTTPS